MSETAPECTSILVILEGSLPDPTIAAWPPRVVAGYETTDRLYVGDAVTIDGVVYVVRSGHRTDTGAHVLTLF